MEIETIAACIPGILLALLLFIIWWVGTRPVDNRKKSQLFYLLLIPFSVLFFLWIWTGTRTGNRATDNDQPREKGSAWEIVLPDRTDSLSASRTSTDTTKGKHLMMQEVRRIHNAIQERAEGRRSETADTNKKIK